MLNVQCCVCGAISAFAEHFSGPRDVQCRCGAVLARYDVAWEWVAGRLFSQLER